VQDVSLEIIVAFKNKFLEVGFSIIAFNSILASSSFSSFLEQMKVTFTCCKKYDTKCPRIQVLLLLIIVFTTLTIYCTFVYGSDFFTENVIFYFYEYQIVTKLFFITFPKFVGKYPSYEKILRVVKNL
jgi:hypothetical protein